MKDVINKKEFKEEYSFSPYINDKFMYLFGFLGGLIILTLGSILFIIPVITYSGILKSGNLKEIVEGIENVLLENQGVLMILSEGLGISLSIIFFRKVLIEDFKNLKKNLKIVLLSIGIGVVSVIVFGKLFELFQEKLNISGTSDNQALLEKMLNGKGNWALIISIACIGPIFEELIFRKFAYGYLSRTRLHVVLSVSITALIFALIHCLSEDYRTFAAYFFLLNYLVLSLSITIPYVLSKENIYVSIIIHMVNNIISLLTFFGVINAVI